ncbi:hypothetical protein BU17DRAFT_80976 [Hysterangium stoloniferum]|nr:hypothetical protein BU17DRAFT_80976 [Hysterangium stoloniferum]
MSKKSSIFSSHIISVLVPGWGHLKPFIALASKIVQLHPNILITIHTLPQYDIKAFPSICSTLPIILIPSCRHRITTVDDEEFRNQAFSPDQLLHGFESFYKKLTNCQPIVCPRGKAYAAAPAPTIAIIDIILPDVAQVIRDIGGKGIFIMGWTPANLSSCMRLLGPQELGGYGDLNTQLRTLAIETAKPITEIEDEVYFPGNVISIPGLPLMYGYEYSTQEAMFVEVPKVPWFIIAQQFMKLCDGMISTTSIAYEAENIHAWRNWLLQTNRKFYVVGPVPPPPPACEERLEQSIKTAGSMDPCDKQNIISFLDRALDIYGRDSLIYISFGSAWWPKTEYVWKLIDILLECEIPFILAHASPMAVIPPEVSAKVEASGLGLLSPWTPQELILKHPATGWFLTHCGHNSIMEALNEGVPMIAWPVAGDQPPAAARLTLMLDVAFELLEVRTGKYCHKPLYRGFVRIGTAEALENEIRSVFRDARGAVGERKRRNVHRIRDAMQGAWDEGGDALEELRNLLKDLC